MKRMIPILLAAALFCGCAVQQKLTYTESSTRNVEPRVGALITPMIADLELISDQKIAPYEKTLPGSVTPQLVANIDGWKKIALSEAAAEYGADVLIGATIRVDTRNDRLVVTVTGWPARYVRFRPATEADGWVAPLLGAADTDPAAFLTEAARKSATVK